MTTDSRSLSADSGSSDSAAAIKLIQALLSPLASLRLTVVLLVMSIFIILVGTLAQVDKDMWTVLADYFKAWIAWVEFKVLLPRTWFGPWHRHETIGPWLSHGFPFPGGAMIGLGLAINLLAASISSGLGWVLNHFVRAKTPPNYRQLAFGALTLAVGTSATAGIILLGHNQDGLQGAPPFSWETLWSLSKVTLFLTFLASAVGFVVLWMRDRSRIAELILLGLATVGLGVPAIYLLIPGNDTYVGDSGMRILWQLTQATIASLILLGGFVPLFGRRSGVTLLHSGVALLMFGQFFVGRYDVEQQMSIEEGTTANFGQDIRSVELAVIDRQNEKHPDEEVVVAVPLYHTGKETRFLLGKQITHDALPFDIEVVDYLKNSDVRMAKADDKKIATAGRGKDFVAEPRRASSGADMGGGVDLASAYLRLKRKDNGTELGTHLVSQVVLMMRGGKEFGFDDQVELDGKTYNLQLRFERTYKPYSITLKDVRKDDYLGTNTPRNYSSDIHLVDASRKVDREIKIWMNNPLRYAGETFYQSGYHKDPATGKEHTTLQVVRNAGWMIPYVACMMVVVGMCAHFVLLLIRFLRKQSAVRTFETFGQITHSPFAMLTALLLRKMHAASREKQTADANASRKSKKRSAQEQAVMDPATHVAAMSSEDVLSLALPAAVLVIFGAWFLYDMRPPREPRVLVHDAPEDKAGERAGEEKKSGAPEPPVVFNIHAFGKLPIIADGRVKPFDTLARNSLRVLSGREEFKDADGKKLPAIRWLLDVIAETEAGMNHKVFRIDSLEVLDTLKLERRSGFLYSVDELRKNVGELEKQAEQAHEQEKAKGAESLTVYQRKLLEVETRIRTFTKLGVAFRFPSLPELKMEDERSRMEYARFFESIDRGQLPLAVPVKSDKKGSLEWQPYSKALVMATLGRKFFNRDPDESVIAMNTILTSYARGEAKEFNDAIDKYGKLLRDQDPEQLSVQNSFWNRTVEKLFGSFYAFESYFNHVAPFYHADVLYVIAFVLVAASWLGMRRPLNSAAFGLLVLALTIHTVALAARIYISGRPPVTNLYSSAVFIGWGAVVAGLLLEVIFGLGIGNVVAAATGFASLYIAHNLAADGDTFAVLQAVLDTQFWLATHVVCISLGYTATFLAGGIGVVYVLRGLLTTSLSKSLERDLTRMTYGVICFGIFFSFFGTVLGGLWADDSWGRFWGWDPKENGALIIVIWNAVVLHSRWAGLIRERGLAVLSIIGNIVTAWSWFGVNELGVGLHSYGFTEGRLKYLGLFVLSQMILVGLGCLPKSIWMSGKSLAASPTTAETA